MGAHLQCTSCKLKHTPKDMCNSVTPEKWCTPQFHLIITLVLIEYRFLASENHRHNLTLHCKSIRQDKFIIPLA